MQTYPTNYPDNLTYWLDRERVLATRATQAAACRQWAEARELRRETDRASRYIMALAGVPTFMPAEEGYPD